MSDKKITMKNVPRRRDSNGKYISGSDSFYHNQIIETPKSVWISDGKFHSNPQEMEKIQNQYKNHSKSDNRKLTREKLGYESFSFSFSATITFDDFSINLPKDFSYKSIYVEDVFLEAKF